jgi:hypothetical protein
LFCLCVASCPAQQESFDACCLPACPEQLRSPVLHGLLADPELRALSLGAKGVGSQGDGSIQVRATTCTTRHRTGGEQGDL